MTGMKSGISFVIPAYNEGGSIPGMLLSCLETARKLSINFEVIVVDDGSTDNTADAVALVRDRNPEVVLLRHECNMGIARATRHGFAVARFSHILYTDADGQFDPSDVTMFLPFCERYDFVVGYRVKRADPFYRRVNAWLYNLSLRTLFGIRLRDIDCAFKLIKTESLRSLKADSKSAFYFAELVKEAVRAGMTFHEVPVNHYPRKHGMQSGANPRVVICALLDMMRHLLKERIL
jgi:glycosyltransferase involved in cell wall biosynthesis